MFTYVIFGIQSGDAAGLPFRSCVPNLQDKPDLWLDECPYQMPRAHKDHPGVWVELADEVQQAMKAGPATTVAPRHEIQEEAAA